MKKIGVMKTLIVLYDNWCPNCARFIKRVKKMDGFSLIQAQQLRDASVENYHFLDYEKATKQMASYNGRWHYGYASLFLIFIRLPVLWILFPLFLLLKITGIGQMIYLRFAVRRKIIPLHCTENTCTSV